MPSKPKEDMQMDDLEESISVLTDRSSAYSSRSGNGRKESETSPPPGYDEMPPGYDEFPDEKEEVHKRDRKDRKKHHKNERKRQPSELSESDDSDEGNAAEGGKARNKDKERKKSKKPRRKKNVKPEIVKVKPLREYKPYFIYSVGFLNVVIFIYLLIQSGWSPSNWAQLFTGIGSEALLAVGAKRTREIVEKGEVWRLITPIFLHNSLVHLLLSTLCLLGPFSRGLEKEFGHWRVIAIYLCSGIFGTMLSAIMIPEDIGCGATGAWFGFMGTMVVDYFKDFECSVRGFKTQFTYFIYILIVTLLLLGIGLVPFVDNYAHIGGWIMGVVTGSALMHSKKECRYWDNQNKPCKNQASHFCSDCNAHFCGVCSNLIHRQEGGRGKHKPKKMEKGKKNFCTLLWFSILAFLMIAGLAILYAGTDFSDCTWCRYINCVDSPLWDCCAQRDISGLNGTITKGGCTFTMKQPTIPGNGAT